MYNGQHMCYIPNKSNAIGSLFTYEVSTMPYMTRQVPYMLLT